MKTIKKFVLLIIGLIALTMLNSCEDDRFGNSGSSGGKRLVKITNFLGVDMTFHYKDGKLIEMVDETNREKIYFTYSGKTVKISGDAYGSEQLILHLNNDGFAESGTFEGYELGFEYSNGYLTKYIDFYDGSTVSIKYDTNGNLSTMQYSTKYNATEEYTFTSSNYPTKGKSYCFVTGSARFEELIPVYYAGLLGKDPKNFVSKVDITRYTNNTITHTFSNYSFYDDGYIKTMTVTDDWNKDDMSFTYQ